MSQRRGAFPPEVRDLIVERSGGRCERCGTPMSSMEIHHRRPRGMGGSRKPDTAGAANGLALHPSCHAWIESNRKSAYTLGFLVGYGRSPEEAEVMLWSGWAMLAVDGSVSSASAAGVCGEASPVAEVHNVG